MIETDKVVTEVEAPVAGVVLKIIVLPEEERPIGAPLAVLGEAGEVLSEADLQQLVGVEPPPAVSASVATVPPAAAPPPAALANRAGGRVKISPIARKLAEQHGIDTATLQGTGSGGRISKDDVLRVIKTGQAASSAASFFTAAETTRMPAVDQPATSHTIPLTGMRGRVAERMFQSWNTIPRVTEVM